MFAAGQPPQCSSYTTISDTTREYIPFTGFSGGPTTYQGSSHNYCDVNSGAPLSSSVVNRYSPALQSTQFSPTTWYRFSDATGYTYPSTATSTYVTYDPTGNN